MAATVFLRRELTRWIQHLELETLVVWNEDFSSLQLAVTPRSLLQALWVQFCMAITENASFRRCEQCQRWFSEASRSDKLFCSDACRIAAYRLRKSRSSEQANFAPPAPFEITAERVRELLVDGVTTDYIALHYDVDHALVTDLAAETSSCGFRKDRMDRTKIGRMHDEWDCY